MTGNLQGNWINIGLSADVANDSVRARLMGGPLHGRCGSGNKGDFHALCCKQPDQSQSQPGCPAGDGDTKVLEIHGSFHH